MDYSQYRPEDAASLRRRDERIQLLREQRELGQQILKEMDDRDAYVASLENPPGQQRPRHGGSTQQHQPARNGIATPDSIATQARGRENRPQAGSPSRYEEIDENIQVGASSSAPRGQKRRAVSPAQTESSRGEGDWRPAPRVSGGPNRSTKKYPLFSSQERYSTIIKHDGRVVELACTFCGGNYFKHSSKGWTFLSGVQGVQKHIHMKHPDEHERIKFTNQPFFQWVAETCVRHILSDSEKDDVRSGRYRVSQIIVRGDREDGNAVFGDI